MILFKHSKDLHSYLDRIRISKNPVGFVPTMGALHKGHLSLIDQCKSQAKVTVCSIFVNPTQFNNPDDFKKYPVTIEKDIQLLEEHGCDILFLPDEKEMYPDAASRDKYFDLGYLETILEGKFRPGHFQGVCLIVEKLLTIINPDKLFIGQKDFQQCLVIKKLIEIDRLKTEVVIAPILREENGLAMSSRNTRLSSAERILASELYHSLQFIKNHLTNSNFNELRNEKISYLENLGFKVDYLELANTKNLRLTDKFEKNKSNICLIAAYLNDVRLIDNLIINM
jgi:pantoate--beta-alanine ligase